ncbi:hypothetical protein T484DRAFT_3629640 [Baffinella frigidus]|nr:hypothetical protein T484DRAFT_3629640 [Cryptophyta sp. CCMP2293]
MTDMATREASTPAAFCGLVNRDAVSCCPRPRKILCMSSPAAPTSNTATGGGGGGGATAATFNAFSLGVAVGGDVGDGAGGGGEKASSAATEDVETVHRISGTERCYMAAKEALCVHIKILEAEIVTCKMDLVDCRRELEVLQTTNKALVVRAAHKEVTDKQEAEVLKDALNVVLYAQTFGENKDGPKICQIDKTVLMPYEPAHLNITVVGDNRRRRGRLDRVAPNV